MDIFYLGIGLLMASVWLVADSKLRQVFLPNCSVASDVGFFMMMILPLPFLIYINRIQKSRYEKLYIVFSIVTIINAIILSALQVLDIKDFSETMLATHIIIICVVLIIFITIGIDIKKHLVKEYAFVAFGLLVFGLTGALEVCEAYNKHLSQNGASVCVGLVVLLFTAIVKTGKDLIDIEQERHIAVAASQSRALFLANMSHEIRTPINTIMGMNEMILRENHNNNTREYAKNIESASKMLVGLINDILDFSKLDAGKIEICETPYNVAELINDVIVGANSRIEDKGLRVRVNIDKKIPSVLSGDELRVKQIMSNLLSNAVKYTDDGSITIKVSGFWSAGKYYLVFEIQDTGIGIKEEDIPKLFDSFQRIDMKRNRNVQGTGLGLSITKQLVEIMDGRIDVKSEYEKGSCFTVTIHQEVVSKIPLGDLTKAYTEAVNIEDEREEVRFSSNAKVLVVDDNEMNLKVMKALLNKTGITIDAASSGTECYGKCKSKKYDLIFMDHMMPDPDGVETFHMIRDDEEGQNRDTNVIVLTANAIKGVEEEYAKEGFADYISKPVEYETLEKYLKKYLGKFMEVKNDTE